MRSSSSSNTSGSASTRRCTRPGSISLAISSACPLRMDVSSSSGVVPAKAGTHNHPVSDGAQSVLTFKVGGYGVPAFAGTTASLLRRHLVGPLLHLDIHQVERRLCVLDHIPALEPLVGALHLVERDRRGVADLQPALAQVLDLERRDLRIGLGVVVDEIML